MADRDVLICGSCSSQFSDLRIFIEHKQTCGNAVTTVANNVDFPSVITVPQQTSHIGIQPIVVPNDGHASIVSLPVGSGMSHVILQASSGLSQMYRIVLEPNLRASSQITAAGPGNHVVSHVHNLSQATEDKNDKDNHISNTTPKVDVNEKDLMPVVDLASTSLGEVTLTRLSSLAPLDSTGWNASRSEVRTSTALFDAVDSTTVLAEKRILDAPKLETEDREIDLSFFASHQQQNTKCKESISTPNYSNDVQQGVHITPSELTPGKNIGKGKFSKGMNCQYPSCNFFTLHKKDMIRHERKHTGEKPFQCMQCNTRFSRQDKLKIHLRTHSMERPYACTEIGCTYRGNEKAHLIKHMRTHTNERPYRCQFCPYGAKDASHLTVHLRSHTGDSPFYCQKEGCSATFKTSSDLKRHEKIHTGVKPYKCSDCDYASAIKSNLKVHYRSNHYNGEKYGCKSCSFIGTSRKQFKEHGKVHIRAQPHLRGPSIEGIERIKSNFQKSKRSSKTIITKNYKCGKCEMEFVREDSLRSHMRQHDRKEGNCQVEDEQDPLRALSPKSKGKGVYALNIVLQGDSYNVPREISSSEKPQVIMMEKHTTNQNAVNVSHTKVSESMKSGVNSRDNLSPYIFSVDGLTSTYSNIGSQSKEAVDSIVSQSNTTQDEPLVQVISSPISNLSLPTQHTAIINHSNVSHPTCITTPMPVTQPSNNSQHGVFTNTMSNLSPFQNLNSTTAQHSSLAHFTYTTHVGGTKGIRGGVPSEQNQT